MGSSDEVAAAGDRLEGLPPEEILAWASERYAPKLTFATGFGPEGVALIDLIARHHLPVDLFTLDTGLFFPETYALWRRLEERYGLTIRAVKPAQTVDEQAAQHGPALWERNPDSCCELRKVQPLRRALGGFDAWVTAIRRDQTDSRASARVVEWDAKFGLVKVNPLAAWTTRDVWRYLQANQVPYNPLHDRGYASIGCWPCTTPLLAGESGRAGRWRGRVKTECGLHLAQPPAPEGNIAMPLVAPHGGTLVDRIAPPEQAAALRARAEALPALKLDARELADLELLAVGAVSPLTGFMGSKDYRSVLDSMRLANGTVWPVPLTLALDESVRARIHPGAEVALKDEQGRLWGTLAVSEVFERDPLDEARNVYRTESPEHPGVAYLLSRPRWLAAGDVTVLPLPADLP
ncbi:MAG TPA: phosphoadenylyl-sulfate reductase, partial [Myxococcaceae bacterium]|nr:phosphoadenylyl-sulfate reductase [Myxococcaceae bacterium]